MAQNPRKTKLRAAPGTTDVTVGTETLPIASDGTVTVPSEAVASLTGVGGFALDEIDLAPPPDGHVEVDHDDVGATLSIDGRTFGRGEDGRMFLPISAVPSLEAHGFRLISLEQVAAKARAALETLEQDDATDPAEGDPDADADGDAATDPQTPPETNPATPAGTSAPAAVDPAAPPAA